MGVFTKEYEITLAIPPAKAFKTFALDFLTLIPKIFPEAVASAEIIEGDGGPGSITKITFVKSAFLKYKIEDVDKEKLLFNYSLIESDHMPEWLEKASYETEFVASPDGGTIVKNPTKYYTKGDSEINEETINAGREKYMELLKAVEAYVLANPDA